MAYIIVLFNLKDRASREDYEAWARATDLPIVRELPSIDGFDLFRLAEVRGSNQSPPFQYAEILTISDLEQFGTDVRTDTMKRVASEFRQFADSPIFITSEKIEI